MVAPVIAVHDDGLDVGFEHTRQKVVFQQGSDSSRSAAKLVPAPGLRVEGAPHITTSILCLKC